MKRTVLVLISAIFLFICIPKTEAIVFNDGGYHLIDYVINDSVIVDEGMPGVGTHIEISATGGIDPGQGSGWVVAYGDSEVTVSGGELGWSLTSNDDSIITIKDDAYIRGELITAGDSYATFQDSSIRLSAVTFGNGHLDIKSGSIGASLEVSRNSEVFWSGGTIGGPTIKKIMLGNWTSAVDTSLLTIIGSSLAVNGTPLEYGDFVSDFAASGTYSGFPCLTGTLTGTLANSDIIDNNFFIFDDSDIVFTPEPGTMMLFTLGGMFLRKRRA